MLFRLVQEVEIIEDHQVYNMVFYCIDRLEGGIRCRLILHLLVSMTHNEIVNIFNFGLIHIFIPQFLMDDLVDVILL